MVKDGKQWPGKSMREKGERSLLTKAETEETTVETRTRRFDKPCGEDKELLR